MQVLFRLAIVYSLAIACHAQTSIHGALRGRVIDPNGLGVPESVVTLTNTSTGAKLTTSSEGAGVFLFPRLQPGRYQASVERPGFRKSVVDDLVVAVNETTATDLQLAIGEVSEVVTVNGEPDIVQSQRVELAGRVDERRVRELPLNGENFARLVLLAPGIASGSPNNPSISGARPVANSYTVDGSSANDERGSSGLSLGGGGAAEFNGASPNLISTEAIQEFSIITSGADATFGRGSGGQVNIITKSGTNEVHGCPTESGPRRLRCGHRRQWRQ